MTGSAGIPACAPSQEVNLLILVLIHIIKFLPHFTFLSLTEFQFSQQIFTEILFV